MKWHRAFNDLFSTGPFRIVQPSGYLDTNTFNASVHCILSCHFCCTTEVNTTLKLASDVISKKLSSEFWAFHFFDVDTNWERCNLFDLALQLSNPSTAPSDHNAGFRGVNRDGNQVCRTFDLNTIDRW